jgi:TonB family protein
MLYALLISALLHAATFVHLGLNRPRAGQQESSLYIAAQLIDRTITSAIPADPVPRSTLDAGKSLAMTVRSSDVKAAVAAETTETGEEIAPDKRATEQRAETGRKSSAAGELNYLSIVLRQIDRQKQYPYQAWRQQIEGKVEVDMLVNDDGSATVLAAVSAFPAFTDAAKEAIRKAQPLPVPVRSASAEPVKISFTMKFIIRD